MKKAILTSFMLFVTLFCIAQISYENRIEIELKDGYSKEQILEIGEQGFVIHSRKNKRLNGKNTWRYELFGADMNAVMSKEIQVNRKRNHIRELYIGEYVLIFYQNLSGGDVTFATMHIPSMEIVLIEEIQTQYKEGISKMGVLGDYIFLATNIDFFMINWKTGERKTISEVVEGYSKNQVNIFDIQPLRNEIIVCVNAGEKTKQKKSYLIRFDSTGKKLGQINLTEINPLIKNLTEINPRISSFSANQLDDDRLIFSGTYGVVSLDFQDSEGIFVGTMKNGDIEFLKGYQYAEIENFFTYLPSKKQEKIKRKKQKDPIFFNRRYIMNMHPAISSGDGYLLMGEAFLRHDAVAVPSYSGTTTYSGGGIERTHISLIRFDTEGDLLWDKAFKISESSQDLRPKLLKATQTKENKDYTELFFIDNKKLTLKRVNHEGEIIQEYEVPIIEKEEEQKGTYLPNVAVNYWYDNYFIVHRKHKIKNNKTGKQRVFFVSKIKYE